MATERIIGIADTYLKKGAEKGNNISLISFHPLASSFQPPASSTEVRIAMHLLVEAKLIRVNPGGKDYILEAEGIAVAGNLRAHLDKLKAREEAAHKANLATVESANTMREQLDQAERFAAEATRASWWSIGAALVSAAAAVIAILVSLN